MSHLRTVLSLFFACLSVLFCAVQSSGQGTPSGIVEYSGLEFSVAKAELLERDAANSYLLVILRIKNNSDKPVRYVAKNEGALMLDDDLGKRYYGLYAQEFPESGIEILPGGQQKIGYAFQKPGLDCSMFTMSFSKYDLKGVEYIKSLYHDGGTIEISIPVRNIIVMPKVSERHETDLKKEININGLIFIVNEAFIWGGPARDGAARSSPPASGAYLGVTFDFINAQMTNRVDVNGDFSYSLADDLGNKYKSVRPSGYPRRLKNAPERYPRVYPKESYQETVFFEPPSDSIKYLVFTINAKAVGVKKEISVKIPADGIAKQD